MNYSCATIAVLAWVLWYQQHFNSLKGELESWRVTDAFETFKSCKAGAEHEANLLNRAKKKEDPSAKTELPGELNAGFYFYRDQGEGRSFTEKWLCLPAGTQPDSFIRNTTKP